MAVARDLVAFDRASVRRIDGDGHLHIEAKPGCVYLVSFQARILTRRDVWPSMLRLGNECGAAHAAVLLMCNQVSYIMGTRLPNDGGISLRGG